MCVCVCAHKSVTANYLFIGSKQGRRRQKTAYNSRTNKNLMIYNGHNKNKSKIIITFNFAYTIKYRREKERNVNNTEKKMHSTAAHIPTYRHTKEKTDFYLMHFMGKFLWPVLNNYQFLSLILCRDKC